MSPSGADKVMPEKPASPFPAVNSKPPPADDKLKSPVAGFKDIELPKVPDVFKLRVLEDDNDEAVRFDVVAPLVKLIVWPLFPTDPAVKTWAKVDVGGNGGKLLSKNSRYVSR